MKHLEYLLLQIALLITLQTYAQKSFFPNIEPVFTNLDSAINHKNDVLNLSLYYTDVVLEKLHFIGDMPNIKFLSITGIYLPNLPSEIFKLKDIRALKLSCSLKEMPTQLRNLKTLEFLDISGNSISEIPDWIGDVKSLRTLILTHNPLKRISNSIGNCKNLRYLDLSSIWKLKFVPESIGQLSNLEELCIVNSDLYWLPESIRDLKKLTILSASNNKLQELPDGIINLKRLKILNLKGNNISKLPYRFDSLQSLENLDLGYNPIEDNPSLRLPISLKKLRFINSKLTVFPEAIKHCINLEDLQITGSEISIIPAWITNLQKLKWLALKHNRITIIPLFLKDNISLERINLSDNLIDSIPAGILSMHNLKYFLIGDNVVTHIPEDILKSKSLEYFAIKESNIDSVEYKRIKFFLKGSVIFERTDLKQFATSDDCPCYSEEQLPSQIKNSEPEVFTKSEIKVRFSKGAKDMQDFFSENVSFSKIQLLNHANEKFIDTVLLKFAVFPYSGVTYVTPEAFKKEETKNEAIRLLRLSCPYWIPAFQGGREVKAFTQVAFIFEQYYDNGQLKKELTVKEAPLWKPKNISQ